VILAGDIGGTHTRLAFFQERGGGLTAVAEETFPSREHASLEAVLQKFIAAHSFPITCACFGIAGPVGHGRCDATNLPWVVDSSLVARELGLKSVGLINDLEANAWGVAVLETKDFVVLNEGAAGASGNAAIISAGTGLGEAGLYWDGKRHRPFATEGGHTDFAPRNRLEVELLEYLLKQFQRVSYERIVSGPGLLNIYRFLRDSGRSEEPPWLAEQMRQAEPGAVISQAALSGRSELCTQALDLFVSLYGAEAGNLALKVMATGGVFLGGGIAPKIIQRLKDPVFLNAFTAKGRMKPLLQAMPVRVILNDQTALLGAARFATLCASESSPLLRSAE
jgi:glucokinase